MIANEGHHYFALFSKKKYFHTRVYFLTGLILLYPLVNNLFCKPGGIHVIDVSDRNNPEFEDCFWQDGYTHDAQCVTYSGPDTRYTGREICIAFNEDTFTIVDITGPDYEELSRTGYPNHAYTHQVRISFIHKLICLGNPYF